MQLLYIGSITVNNSELLGAVSRNLFSIWTFFTQFYRPLECKLNSVLFIYLCPP